MTLLSAALVSVAISYVFAGWRYVHEALNADPIRKPFWVRNASVGAALLHGAIWPIGVAAPQIYGHPGKEARYTIMALADVMIRMLPTAVICFLSWLAWKSLA